MTKKLRGEEEWAREMIQQALGVAVVQHDDGSTPRMYDLKILHDGQPPAAVEVVAAADAASIELWNIFNGGGRWQAPGIQGGWMVALDPLIARAKRIKRELPELLGQLEALGISQLRPSRRPSPLEESAVDLGIASAGQSGTDYPGSIYITLELSAERSGGFVADTGDALASWVGDFLHEPKQRDVRDKLASSGAQERHAFIYLPGFTTAPFPASDLLLRDGAPLPHSEPRLPGEISHVWAVSTWSSGDGMRWSPEAAWERFAKTVPRVP